MMKYKPTDIAIIGMACRFPEAANADEFWQNLINGRSSIREIPEERWKWQDYWGNPQSEGNFTNSKWGGFLSDVAAFDPAFFGFSAREAEIMDPQQRLALELSWSCLEDAGLRPSSLSGDKVGVFMGVFNHDYKELQERRSQNIETYYSTGTASSVIANRISHIFNFRGPSIAIDSSCSSSLYAIHLAMNSLNSAECSLALAGGVNLILTPTRHIAFSKAGMMSPNGSCKTFDDLADGYVRSEGAGVILLKPLDKALQEGDRILGILKGSAINHGGKMHTLTYPNPDAQAEVIVEAIKNAGVGIRTISYMEAHGTGTPKGDPLEIKGLLNAFDILAREEGESGQTGYCGLGSAKTNIGHTESAAGVAGVVKVLLSMQNKHLPGLRNFNQLNHRISLEDSPFYIVDRPQEWKSYIEADGQYAPLRAGVSSFGFGGTNAHVILEEAPAPLNWPAEEERKYTFYMIPLSAKTKKQLMSKMEDLAVWLSDKGNNCRLQDISWTLLVGREHFDFRAAFVVNDVADLRECVKGVLENRKVEACVMEYVPKKERSNEPSLVQLGMETIEELIADDGTAHDCFMKMMTLAKLFVKGYESDWKACFSVSHPRRISLPTYPFSRECFWLPDSPVDSGEILLNKRRLLHPLLHENVSCFREQRFHSIFTGAEFFLRDHIVKNRHVLPGVVYLEMARAAAEISLANTQEKDSLKLVDVVWTRPVTTGTKPIRLQVALEPKNSGDIRFTVISLFDTKEPIIHTEGTVKVVNSTSASRLDITKLRGECVFKELPSRKCYPLLSTTGLDYGPAHRSIQNVYCGFKQLLAELSLPETAHDAEGKLILHPSLMDAAFQSAIGFLGVFDEPVPTAPVSAVQPSLPFALQELE
ncbi:beta-ketoacyl synthase N-terminal-like domain-containing protein, partial [Paenibacillus forsythiae]